MIRSPTAASRARATTGGSGIRVRVPPLPCTRTTRWPCSKRSSRLTAQASLTRSPSRPSSTMTACGVGPARREWTNMASNCRCVRPRVGDSVGRLGRRTYSAGLAASTPSITMVRLSVSNTMCTGNGQRQPAASGTYARYQADLSSAPVGIAVALTRHEWSIFGSGSTISSRATVRCHPNRRAPRRSSIANRARVQSAAEPLAHSAPPGCGDDGHG